MLVNGLIIAAGACFVFYLLYTRQFRWLVGVVRNALLGAIGFLALNTVLSPVGLVVGVNALTVFIVGILGLPGFVLLYVTRWIL
jgi:pro-sigmaK processing inhibitor BofA